MVGVSRADHDDIIVHLVVPVVSTQLARASVYGVSVVVADRRPVGDHPTAAAAAGNTAGRGGRPEKHCRRLILDAILCLVRGGVAWRQLPVEFPPASTVYDTFTRWTRSGAWRRIHDALRDRLRVRDGRDRCPTAAIIDSQTVPAADTVH
jgi:transposase